MTGIIITAIICASFVAIVYIAAKYGNGGKK